MIRLRRLGSIAGTLTSLVGVVHWGVGLREYAWPSFDGLWFQGTGMALVLTGALTALAASARAWRWLAVTGLVGNLLGFALALTFGMLSHWRAPQGLVLTALFVAGALGCVPALRQP